MSRSKIITTLFLLMLCGLVTADVNHDFMPIVGVDRLNSASTALDLASDVIQTGSVFCATRTSITSVHVYISAVAGTPANRKMTAILCAISATGDPDEGTPIANGSIEVVGASIAVGPLILTFATPPATTVGTFYGVIVKNTAVDPTTDKFSLYYRGVSNNTRVYPYCVTSTDGAAWTKTTYPPSIVPFYSDGTYPNGFFPGYAATVLVADDHNPDEYASVFTVTNPTICSGAALLVAPLDTGDIVVKFIEDTTTVATRTVTHDLVTDYSTPRLLYIDWPNYSCHSGHTYYISAWSDETAHTTVYANYYYTAAEKQTHFGTFIYGASRNDAGAWTTYNAGVDYRAFSIIPLIGVETITGGRIRSPWGF